MSSQLNKLSWLSGAGVAALWLMPVICVGQGYIGPSSAPPGGLAPSATPQIILLAFDDLVNSSRYSWVQQVLTNHWNPNGVPIQATFFLNSDWTDNRLLRALYRSGHEIAVHTMTHNTHTNTDLATFRAEIVGCRRTLATMAGIPESEIVGFRAPFLEYNPASFQVLFEHGFVYDASIIEVPGALSPDGRGLIWPYTLDYGVPQTCWTGICPEGDFPGLFEVPLWDLLDEQGDPYASMDPVGTYAELTALLRHNFTNRYEGNRAPLGINLHADWLADTNHTAALNDFLAWAQGNFSNVWVVSHKALTAFMREPQNTIEAFTFAPFNTMTNALLPEGIFTRCVYAVGAMWSITNCPVTYPRTDSVYGEAAPMTGGVMALELMGTTVNGFQGRLVVSNDTAREAVEWEAVFAIAGGAITSAGDGTFQTNGTRVTMRPDGWLRPLHVGEVEVVEFSGTRTGAVSFVAESLVLYGLAPQRPRIQAARLGSNGTLVVEWDDTAYGYRVEQSSLLSAADWQPVTNVYGRLSWTNSLPSGVSYYRVLPVP